MMPYSLPCNRVSLANQSMLDRFAEGEEYRHLILNEFTEEEASAEHRWAAVAPLLTVNSISVARNAARVGIETDGFEGRVDYLLLNYLKQRRMMFCVAFHNEGDAILWKMRQPS